jgi:hypothetical protein
MGFMVACLWAVLFLDNTACGAYKNLVENIEKIDYEVRTILSEEADMETKIQKIQNKFDLSTGNTGVTIYSGDEVLFDGFQQAQLSGELYTRAALSTNELDRGEYVIVIGVKVNTIREEIKELYHFCTEYAGGSLLLIYYFIGFIYIWLLATIICIFFVVQELMGWGHNDWYYDVLRNERNRRIEAEALLDALKGKFPEG